MNHVCGNNGLTCEESLTMPKRRHFEIKDLILEALEKYPQNKSQLSKRLGTNTKTVKKHLEELRDLHKVQKVKTFVRNKEKKVWMNV